MPTEKSKARSVADIETPDTANTAIPGVYYAVVGGYNRRDGSDSSVDNLSYSLLLLSVCKPLRTFTYKSIVNDFASIIRILILCFMYTKYRLSQVL